MQPAAAVTPPAGRSVIETRPPGVERCRNCGAAIDGNFCANCGQETAVELPPAGRFLREAAGRYVALDGRLWRTLGALLFRPGFRTSEYLAGRRPHRRGATIRGSHSRRRRRSGRCGVARADSCARG